MLAQDEVGQIEKELLAHMVDQGIVELIQGRRVVRMKQKLRRVKDEQLVCAVAQELGISLDEFMKLDVTAAAKEIIKVGGKAYEPRLIRLQASSPKLEIGDFSEETFNNGND